MWGWPKLKDLGWGMISRGTKNIQCAMYELRRLFVGDYDCKAYNILIVTNFNHMCIFDTTIFTESNDLYK